MLKRPRDNQRKRFYRWEEDFFWNSQLAANNLDWVDCQQFVNKVMKSWRFTFPPSVQQNRSRTGSAWATPGKIHVPYGRCNKIILVHECAHSIVGIGNPRVAVHGPEFVRVFLDVICHFGLAYEDVITSSALNAGLKIMDREEARRHWRFGGPRYVPPEVKR